MGCCGDTKAGTRQARYIPAGHNRRLRSKPFEFRAGRIRKCRGCDKSYWIGRSLFCIMRLRRVGRSMWPDPLAYVPGFAGVETEKCMLDKWTN